MSEEQNLSQVLVTPEKNLPDITPAGDSESLDWRRAHPLSPLVRVWLLFLAVSYFLGVEIFEALAAHGWTLPQEDFGSVLGGFLQPLGVFALPAALMTFFLLALIPHAWSWYTTRYAIDRECIYLRRGVIFKTATEARLDRVQAIDIFQPFVGRLLGLAELKFEVADGSSTLLALRFLKRKDAESLRAQLLEQARILQGQTAESPAQVVAEVARASLLADPAEPPAPVTANRADASSPALARQQLKPGEEIQLAEVPLRRVLPALLLGEIMIPLYLIFGVLAIVALVLKVPFVFEEVVGSVGFIALVISLFGELNKSYGFRVSVTKDSLKLRYGLSSTTSQTVPLGRIQSVRITQPLVWSLLGWFRVTAVIAGYGSNPETGGGNSTRNVLLPVGTGQDLMRLMPYLITEHERGQMNGAQLQAALEGKGDAYGFIPNPPSTRWINWFTYRRNGFAETPAYLLVRSGFFVRKLRVIPREKIQGIRMIEGPLDRLFGVAQLDVGIASAGTLEQRVENLSVHNARALAGRLAQDAAQKL